LHGITRRLAKAEIAPAPEYGLEERKRSLEEVFDADEVFLNGTACEIIGVSHIDNKVIGCGKVGTITHAFEDRFRKMMSEGAPED